MNDPNSFSYTFSANPAPKHPGPAADLFAVDALSQFPLGGDQILARNPRNGREMVQPADHLRTLVDHCSRFRTLEEHVAELMEGSDGAPERAAAIRAVVQSFRDGGLTLSAAEICRDLAPTPTARPVADKPVVAIITCDRPQALARLLESIRVNADLKAIDRLWVIDDSRSAENSARNRELTAMAGAQAPVGFHYFGAAEARELLDALIGQLPHHEQAIRFLIDRELWRDHKSYGLARNFSHLLSVGKRLTVFDDDALCEAYEAPLSQAGVAFSVGQQEAVFFANNAEWQVGLARYDRDPVAGHMQCLGLALPQALSVLGLTQLEQTALKTATTDFACHLGRGSRVLVTGCGSLGDPGTASNVWLGSMSAASSERLATSEGRLQQALEQRCCWVGRERPEFRQSSSMSQVTGFDNREFLPPYFPVGRGEDQIFGQATRFIYPDSVTLQYPWAVPHLPIPARNWTERDNDYSIDNQFPGTLFNRFLGYLDNCQAEDPQSRLAFLARIFMDAAQSPDRLLFDRFVDDRHGHRAWQLQKLQEKLQQSSNFPTHWTSYLESALRQVQASAPGEIKVDTLTSKVGDLQGREVLQFWRDAWRGFGGSLLAWNDIRDAAREIVPKIHFA